MKLDHIPNQQSLEHARLESVAIDVGRERLRDKLNNLLEERRYSPDFSDLMLGITCIIIDHKREYEALPECREQILDEVARVLARTGLPMRTDYSLVDPSGRENRAEQERYDRWKAWLPRIVSDPADLPELGRRAILIASEEFLEKEQYAFPASFNSAHAYRSKVVGLKKELGSEVTAEHPELCQALRQNLPWLVPTDDHHWLVHHFPEAFARKKETLAQAEGECLSRSLQDVEIRAYGDCSHRLSEALNLKNRLSIEARPEDMEVVLRLLADRWSGGEAQAKLAEAFEVSPAELRETVVQGLAAEVSSWTYDMNEPSWYVHSLAQVSSIRRQYDIAVEELGINAERTLAQIIELGSLPLLNGYLEAFSLPPAILTRPEHRDSTVRLMEKSMTRAEDRPEEIPKHEHEILHRWRSEGLKSEVTEAMRNVGNGALASDGRWGLVRFLDFIHARRDSDRGFFIEGARALVFRQLSECRMTDARLTAEDFGLTLSSAEFREAALKGIQRIFDHAPDNGTWDYQRFKDIQDTCKLDGPIDDDRLRNSVRPVILAALRDGTTRQLGMVKWLMDRFAFRGPMEGEDIRQGAIHAFGFALREGNGSGLRLLTKRFAAQLSTEETAAAVMDAWQVPAIKRNALENLRYIPDDVKHYLNRSLALADYDRDIGVAGPITYDRYMEFHRGGRQIELRGFVKSVQREMDALISSEPQDVAALRANPRYRELIMTVFQNNWGTEATYESTESCSDRTRDLARFRLRSNQSFTLAEGIPMRLKAGTASDSAAVLEIEELVNRSIMDLSSRGFAPLQLKRSLLRSIGEPAEKAATERTFQSAVFDQLLKLTSPESDPSSVRRLLIAHHLTQFEDIRNYMRGTQNRAEQALNTEYVNLLELHEFAGDHLRESISRMVKAALQDPETRARATGICLSAGQQQIETRFQTIINRMRPERLGLCDSFRQLCLRELKRETPEQASALDVDTVIAACEERMLDPQAPGLSQFGFSDSFAKKLAGLVRSQREKTMAFLSEIGSPPPDGELLQDMDVPGLIERCERRGVVTADTETLEAFFTESLHAHFQPLMEAISAEVQKFEPEAEFEGSGRRRTVNCFVTKNHTSAHARKTAGVCVSIDNPDRAGEGKPNLWDMENYFQIVLQDAGNKTCLGLVLLHIYDDVSHTGTKRILTASYNPSSTFLYQVNERELFEQLHQQVENFAYDNAVDKIAISSRRVIVTNRTGGTFEEAIKEKAASVEESFQLSEPQRFAQAYDYFNDSLQVTWNRPGRWEQVLNYARGWWPFSRLNR